MNDFLVTETNAQRDANFTVLNSLFRLLKDTKIFPPKS